jgi:hypothetical protein
MKDSLHHRIHKTDLVCPICGMEDEDAHHALIRCTLAKALRQETRTVWSLPSNVAFNVTGKEWLLHLLQWLPPDMRSRVLFLWWRVWHHHNNVVHGDGKATITASVNFLANYLTSFTTASNTHANSTPSWTLIQRTQVWESLFVTTRALWYVQSGNLHPIMEVQRKQKSRHA